MSTPWLIALASYCSATVALCALVAWRPAACVRLWARSRTAFRAGAVVSALFLAAAWWWAGRGWPADVPVWGAAAIVGWTTVGATVWLFSQVGAALTGPVPPPGAE